MATVLPFPITKLAADSDTQHFVFDPTAAQARSAHIIDLSDFRPTRMGHVSERAEDEHATTGFNLNIRLD